MSVDEIVEKAKKIGNTHVTLTGGEPLLHKESKTLVEKLVEEGFFVNIETNGSIDASGCMYESTLITMDYKTISSKMCSVSQLDNINKLREQDVLKIVCRESDFDNIRDMLKIIQSRPRVILSPIWEQIEPQKLVEFAKRLRDENIWRDARVQVQLHKIIWKPNERGV